MKKYTQEKLNKILQKHMLWIDGEEGGERANLYKADLTNADPSDAEMSWANLNGVKGLKG